MEIQGQGWEFDSVFLEGPFDGLETSVISFTPNPPIVSFHILDGKLETERSLGKKLLKKWGEKHIPNNKRGAVYCLEGDPSEYSDEDIVPYHYKEILSYKDYKNKYES